MNTACQVLARETETLNQRLTTTTQLFSRQYESLSASITIPDWYRSWRESHESLKLRIQSMADEWQTLSADIEQGETRCKVYATAEELLKRSIAQAQADVLLCEGIATRTSDLAEKAYTALHKLVDDGNGKGHFTIARQRLGEQATLLKQANSEYYRNHDELLMLQAQQQHLTSTIDQAEQIKATEQRTLDMWMQRFNANNPPVQMAELERVLADGKEWGQIRKQVRDNSMQIAILQARVDNLRAQIIALQANGLRPVSGNGEAEQDQLAKQIEELESKRRDVLMQIAKADETLRRHQQTTTQE